MRNLSAGPKTGRARRGTRAFALAIVFVVVASTAMALPQDPRQQQEEAEELSELRRAAVKMGTEGLVAPKLLEQHLPEYTEEAKRAGIEGDVYVEAVVTKEGTVAEPKLIRGLEDDELNRRALASISGWKFEPGTKDDEPVDVIALFTVTFRIQ